MAGERVLENASLFPFYSVHTWPLTPDPCNCRHHNARRSHPVVRYLHIYPSSSEHHSHIQHGKLNEVIGSYRGFSAWGEVSSKSGHCQTVCLSEKLHVIIMWCPPDADWFGSYVTRRFYCEAVSQTKWWWCHKEEEELTYDLDSFPWGTRVNTPVVLALHASTAQC